MPCALRHDDCTRPEDAAQQTRDRGPAPRPDRAGGRRHGVHLALDKPRMLSASTFALAIASAAAMLLAGCATPGHQAPPATENTAATVGLDPAAQTTPVQAQWWHQFGDAQLNALVDQALAGSPNLAAAQVRVAKAQSVIDATNGADGPQVGFDASMTRQRLANKGLFPPPYAGSTFNTDDAQIKLSWTPDFFGRQRADLEAAVGRARAAQADADVAAQQIATQVVRGYFTLARLHSQREVAVRTLEQREQMLKLIQDRVGAGLDTVVELREGEGALPDTRAQIEAIDEQISLTHHALAALAAQPPQSLDALAPTLAGLAITPTPPVLGADLLARRPEVAAALQRVEASVQDVKSQRTRFYPDINLGAFIGLNAIGGGNFFEQGSRIWGYSPAIHLPIFDGGTLRAELKGKSADRDAAIQAYNQVVIDAAHEAADAVTSSASIARQQVLQAQALDKAESSYAFAKQRYAQGLGNQLVVLNAETQTLTQRRLDVDLRWRALDTQAQLMKALGGGWTAPEGTPVVPAAASAPQTTAKNDTRTPA